MRKHGGRARQELITQDCTWERGTSVKLFVIFNLLFKYCVPNASLPPSPAQEKNKKTTTESALSMRGIIYDGLKHHLRPVVLVRFSRF
jgi:hypothetical protein